MVVSITGGLGNQMFQYAFGYSHAKRYKENLKLDIFYLGLDKQRKLGIDQYNISYKSKGRLRGAVYYSVRRMIKNGIKLRSWNRFSHSVVEISPLDFQYIEGSNLFAVGNWLNLRYFDEYRDELLNEFRYGGRLNSRQQQLLAQIKNEESLAVHIRRGDYLKPENRAYHVVQKSYYLAALKYIKNRASLSKIYFFSDDIDWCKEEYGEIENTVFIDSSISGNPYTDLELMRNCKYFIIANSTFSWWGAWLSVREGKVKVAPTKWFDGKENEIYNIRMKQALLQDFILIEERDM